MNSRDRVYVGVRNIARRIGLGRDTVRKLLQTKAIRGYKTERGDWYCVESELNADIGKLPGSL